MVKAKVSMQWKGQENYDEFRKTMKRVHGSFVNVGFSEEHGTYDNGQSVVDVALYNEFGTERIPERSFIRSSVINNQALIQSWKDEVMKKLIDHQITVKKALDTIGFRVQKLIQRTIGSHVEPENAESTIASKKAHNSNYPDTTLMDTGTMQRSVMFKSEVK